MDWRLNKIVKSYRLRIYIVIIIDGLKIIRVGRLKIKEIDVLENLFLNG